MFKDRLTGEHWGKNVIECLMVSLCRILSSKALTVTHHTLKIVRDMDIIRRKGETGVLR